MKLSESEEKIYLKMLEMEMKIARPLGQKYVDYMRRDLDERFAFRASLHPSEIDGESLNLRWRSKLRLWVARKLKYLRATRNIKKRNSFKLDA